MPDDGLLRSNSTEFATEEKARIFQSINGRYDVARLKSPGYLLQLLVLLGRKKKFKSAKSELSRNIEH